MSKLKIPVLNGVPVISHKPVNGSISVTVTKLGNVLWFTWVPKGSNINWIGSIGAFWQTDWFANPEPASKFMVVSSVNSRLICLNKVSLQLPIELKA